MKALIKTLTNRHEMERAEDLGLTDKPKPEYGWSSATFRLDDVVSAYQTKKNEIMVCFSSGDDMIIQGGEDMLNAIAAYQMAAENTLEMVRRGLEISEEGQGGTK